MGYGPETRKHARSRWIVAVYVAVAIFVVGALVAVVMSFAAQRSPEPDPTDTPPPTGDVTPVTPPSETSEPGEPSPVPTSGPIDPGGPLDNQDPHPADWANETQIRVYTFGSSSCPARLDRVEVVAADEITVHFDGSYGNQVCTMDYVGKEHIVDVPEEASGRPLMVRVLVEQ
ncbi:hypothetical protein [Zhihengliuella halotolerans]|uniref:Uncharacterized protein n=1 Tax=Zhihengliuella halotolerans TaxID=370736 RepID=A0A4Q8ADY8_9MICC|nr:hypothetical protein [Zhihengliuella halotolerans]RZU62001.1 hypothetical protein EV380_1587 [Zhihengliuella halotolerans]